MPTTFLSPGSFTVFEDETYNGDPAFIWDVSCTLINHGTITSTTTAFDSFNGGGLMDNRGVVHVNGAGVVEGLYNPNSGPNIVNSGMWWIQGNFAYGLYDWGGATLTNNSDWIVEGASGVWGAYLNNGGSVVNAGDFIVSSNGIATGIIMERSGTVNNSGLIQATGSVSYGIRLAEADGSSPNIINSGTITAQFAIEGITNGSLAPTFNILNTGTINGIIDLQQYDDVIDNRGVINGNVFTWLGDDLVDNTLGAINGVVFLEDGNDEFRGGANGSVVRGNVGDDVLNGGSGNDEFYGESGLDILTGGGGDDYLSSGSGPDTLDGGDGDDILDGGTGTDTINGGAGFDLASYEFSTSAVTVSLLLQGVAQDTGGGWTDTLNNIEDLAGSAFNDALTGDGAANFLFGLAGNDTLVGGGGADRLEGGDGADAASYANAASGVIANLAAPGANSGDAAGDVYVSIETLVGSAFADTLIGDGGANSLIGDSGADTLTGGAGVDAIDGGVGDDIINYNFGDGVDASIDGGDGTDRIVTQGNAGGETLDVRWNGTSFTFWKGTNVVSLEEGVADMGGGVDWLRHHNSTLAISINLTAGTATGFVSIANIENAWGSAFADTLTGSAVANIIRGGAGDDQIDGGAGNDTLIGDDGVDTINGGADADTIYGLSGADIINGGDGADTIYYAFGEGVDAIDGGAGTDTIICQGNSGAETLEVIWDGSSFTFFKGGAVTSIEQAIVDMGVGGDWLRYTGSTIGVSINLGANTASGFVSIANVENAAGGSGADAITGSGAANNLLGNDGADTIDGAGGNDTVNGGAGADTITGGAGGDNLVGGADSDTFMFATGSGGDNIADFDANAIGGQDFLDISAYGITAGDFASRVTITDQGVNTLITIDGINTIILFGVTGDGDNLITQADFILGP